MQTNYSDRNVMIKEEITDFSSNEGVSIATSYTHPVKGILPPAVGSVSTASSSGMQQRSKEWTNSASKRPRDMNKEERREHKAELKRARLARMSNQEKADMKEKNRLRMQAAREAEKAEREKEIGLHMSVSPLAGLQKKIHNPTLAAKQQLKISNMQTNYSASNVTNEEEVTDSSSSGAVSMATGYAHPVEGILPREVGSIPIASSSLPTAINIIPSAGNFRTAAANSIPSAGNFLTAAANSIPPAGNFLTAAANSIPSAGNFLTAARNSIPSDGSFLTAAANSIPSDGSFLTAARNSIPSDGSFLTAARNSIPSDGSFLTAAANSIPAATILSNFMVNLIPSVTNSVFIPADPIPSGVVAQTPTVLHGFIAGANSNSEDQRPSLQTCQSLQKFSAESFVKLEPKLPDGYKDNNNENQIPAETFEASCKDRFSADDGIHASSSDTPETLRRKEISAVDGVHALRDKTFVKDECNEEVGVCDEPETQQLQVKRYACDLCQYSSNLLFEHCHHKTLHNKECTYICDLCQTVFHYYLDLKSHLRQHMEQKLYRCRICQCVYGSVHQLRTHKRTHNVRKKPKSFACEKCDYVGRRSRDLERHRKKHEKEDGDKTKERYACQYCDFFCRRSYHMLRHQRVHTDERPFLCDKCDYRSRQSCHLKQHQLIKHQGDPPYYCDICNFSTNDFMDSQVHKRMHTGEKFYLCDLCGYRCLWPNQLRSHIKRDHSDRTKSTARSALAKCDLCQETYNSFRDLKKHLNTHIDTYTCNFCGLTRHDLYIQNIDQVGQNGDAELNSGTQKAFSCNLCDFTCSCRCRLKLHRRELHMKGKVYCCSKCDYSSPESYNLKRHWKTHMKEERFSCEFCDFKCRQSLDFKMHLVSHENIKILYCKYCDYTTRWHGALKRHLRNHTGERPYICTLCDYTSKQVSNLRMHYKSKHPHHNIKAEDN